MEINEIKKLLYKQNPVAFFKYLRKGNAYYQAGVEFEDKVKLIQFEVPVADMGDADFLVTMDAKLLIRWILKLEK